MKRAIIRMCSKRFGQAPNDRTYRYWVAVIFGPGVKKVLRSGLVPKQDTVFGDESRQRLAELIAIVGSLLPEFGTHLSVQAIDGKNSILWQSCGLEELSPDDVDCRYAELCEPVWRFLRDGSVKYVEIETKPLNQIRYFVIVDVMKEAARLYKALPVSWVMERLVEEDMA